MLRPHLISFLEKISNIYEVIVFTSSQRMYADPILNHFDKERKLIHHRLYRQHCVVWNEGVYIKDLRILGRDLSRVVMVDNAPYSFSAQICNGYPILPFFNDEEDVELLNLEKYLEMAEKSDDVRIFNANLWNIKDYDEAKVKSILQYCNKMESEACENPIP